VGCNGCNKTEEEKQAERERVARLQREYDAEVEEAKVLGKPMPHLGRQVFNVAKSATKFVASGFEMSDKETRDDRLNSCLRCDSFEAGRCLECGCFVALKTQSLAEECPLGNWSEQ